jgi:hypothetical protein
LAGIREILKPSPLLKKGDAGDLTVFQKAYLFPGFIFQPKGT